MRRRRRIGIRKERVHFGARVRSVERMIGDGAINVCAGADASASRRHGNWRVDGAGPRHRDDLEGLSPEASDLSVIRGGTQGKGRVIAAFGAKTQCKPVCTY